jgi:NADP-dependent 3-hydroxy acid dehydrogenase YdfG
LNKIAIITGASGNLGQSVVKKFIDEGFNVVGTVHKYIPSEGLQAGNYHPIELDLMNEDDSQKLVSDAIVKYGSIDVAVLTAGGFAMGDIAATKTNDIYKQYQLNFETAYNIARPVFIQMMKQNNGRIFLIGSQAGLDVSKSKGVTAYALSKSLIFRLAELMNAESKDKNVVTSVVVPGTIDTPQNRESMPGADFSSWETPQQIADIIYQYSTREAAKLEEVVIKIYNKSRL